MKLTRLFIWLLFVSSFLMITACGGGGESASSNPSGEVTMSITDAKPLLPEGADQATNLTVTFTEILVHKPGGWKSLPLAGDPPHTIDLLQFIDGNTTEIVPPVLLEYGKYTQIRIIVSEAEISFDNGVTWDPVVIPPEHLKTDKNFIFDVDQPAAADIVIDFDLSRSLVVTDPFGTPSYKLKPVLHIVEAAEAATITGTIAGSSFGDSDAIITVLDSNDEVYTKLIVEKDGLNDVAFSIFWLVPGKSYRVEIDFDYDSGSETNTPEWCDDVDAAVLPSGGEVTLTIEPPLVCSP